MTKLQFAIRADISMKRLDVCELQNEANNQFQKKALWSSKPCRREVSGVSLSVNNASKSRTPKEISGSIKERRQTRKFIFNGYGRSN